MRSFFLIISFLFASLASAAMISRTIGTVDDEVLTSRQAALSGLMEKILNSNPKDKSLPVESVESAGPEKATILLETALAQEAENFSLGEVSKGDRDALVEKAKKVIADQAVWKKYEFSEKEIEKMAQRKLSSKSLIRLKSDTMKSVISDGEAQNYFEKNRGKFGSSLPFSSFKENIKNFLAQKQLEDRLRSWFEIVRRKHRVHEIHDDELTPPAAKPPAPAPSTGATPPKAKS